MTVGLVATALLVPSAVVGAATKHKLSATARIRALTEVNGVVTTTGTFVDARLGSGAVVARVTTSTVDSDNLTAKSTVFLPQGSYRTTGAIVATPERDGSATYNGTFRITGGTGRFKGIKGSGTLKGVQTAADPTMIVYTIKGSYK
jgi:hypothetical protein